LLIIQTILAVLSIGLFFASLWQFEIVQLRKERKEPYSLPFFITTDKEYSFWGDIWVAMMVISFILMFIAMVLGEIH
jgi:hypothetical protein